MKKGERQRLIDRVDRLRQLLETVVICSNRGRRDNGLVIFCMEVDTVNRLHRELEREANEAEHDA